MTFKEFHILNEDAATFKKNFPKDKDFDKIFEFDDTKGTYKFREGIDDKIKEDIKNIEGWVNKWGEDNIAKSARPNIKKQKDIPSQGNDGKDSLNEFPETVSDEPELETVEKNVAQEIDDFLNKQNYTPNINSAFYSELQINSSSFKTFDALKILYSAINTFKIKKEWVKGENSQILYIIEALSKAAGNDKKLSQDEYANALINLSERIDLAREPNILKFILFLTKLKTANVQLPFNSVYYVGSGDLKTDFDKNSPVNADKKQEEKDLAYAFFNYAHNKPAPKDNEYGSTLRNLANFVRSITFELDSVLDNKTKTVFDINNFVKEESKEVEKKEPEKEGLASRVRGQYLSKKIIDNKRNLDRYDRETEKLKYQDPEKPNSNNSYGYNKTADENQAGKIASRETYGFNIDKPTADEDSINNFGERIKHLIQNDLLDITGVLRIKGIVGERSKANRKNNAISRTWEEAIMRSNNKLLMEGFWKNRFDDLKYAKHDIGKAIDPRQKFRGLRDNYTSSKEPDKKTGEYTSNAENRANDIFKYYMQRSNELIGRYIEKMKNASRKVETSKTYAKRVNKEWGITQAYYDLLRKLFDLKLACRKDCEEGGIAKALKGIAKATERFTGDKEHREKNAISNADAVKKMLEKQIINVEEPNEMQTIAKLVLFNILFGGSKTAKAALEKLKGKECFTALGLENVNDSEKGKAYNTPAELFRAVGVNPKEITEDGLTQLQKSLNKEDCLAQINKFKEEHKTKKENTNSNVNTEAAKQLLEKQLLNVQPVNDLQVMAKLCIYNAVFNSKTMDDAVNKINNGNFKDDFEIEKGVKDFSNTTTSGVRVNLINPKKVYYTPAELFRAVGVNPKEITSECLEQLQKSLNKEECLEQVNRFKNFYSNIKAKITKVASISFEELFKKNGFVIKEESQETINARNAVANVLKNGIDLTDDVKKINLANHSIETVAFKQAIAGNVLLNGVENGQKVYKLFDAGQFEKVKAEQLKYKQFVEKDQQQQQQQQQQQTNAVNNNNVTDTLADGKPNATYWNHEASVVTTNAVDSTYGNGYQKQTPQSRMKEIIYKKGNYTVKTRQMI